MIFFGKVSLVFKYISRLFRLDPGYFMLSVFSQICNAAAAVLMLWLPKIILDEFVGDRNITKSSYASPLWQYRQYLSVSSRR